MATHDWSNEPTSALGLSIRAQRCVESVGVVTIGELCDLTEDEFLATRSFGETLIREVREKLSALGLRMRNPDEPTRYPRRPPLPPLIDPGLRDKWVLSLAALELSPRTCDWLEGAGLTTAGQLATRTAEELFELPGVQARFVDEIAGRLAERGLRLGMRPPRDEGEEPPQ